MLADPESLVVNGVTISLPKTQMGPTQSVYTSADGLTSLTVKQNTTASRFRREIRASQSKVAADPLTGVNKNLGLSVYMVIDQPRFGFSNTEIAYLIEALRAYCVAVNYNKVLGGEY